MQPLVFLSTLLLSTSVAAHGGVIQYTIDGKVYQGYHPGSGSTRLKTSAPSGGSIQRAWSGLGPVNGANGKGLACNLPGTPGQSSAPVAAGGTITAKWNPWPHDGGPLTVWMADCGTDCSSVRDAGSLSWFKIHEGGMSASGRQLWATSDLIRNDNSLSVKVPSGLKAGNYLIRHELINLARAPPAEFYPTCGQLKVTGSGTKTPSSQYLSKFPGAYKDSDNAFKYQFNSWTKAKASQYKLPGPPVWSG